MQTELLLHLLDVSNQQNLSHLPVGGKKACTVSYTEIRLHCTVKWPSHVNLPSHCACNSDEVPGAVLVESPHHYDGRRGFLYILIFFVCWLHFLNGNFGEFCDLLSKVLSKVLVFLGPSLSEAIHFCLMPHTRLYHHRAVYHSSPLSRKQAWSKIGIPPPPLFLAFHASSSMRELRISGLQLRKPGDCSCSHCPDNEERSCMRKSTFVIQTVSKKLLSFLLLTNRRLMEEVNKLIKDVFNS